ncbi:MAG: taurine ABC transporter permease [Betaproteobacteria bacterium]|nr:MAG: taurine ABC transporter permease [Betaproteobacteria bacterium]
MNLTLSRRPFAGKCAFAALVCGWVFATTAHAQDTVRFLNDWRWEGPAAPLLMANQTTFPKANLDVKVTPGTGSAATVAKVASGEFDMGLGDFSALVEFAAKNPNDAPPVAVYVVYERTPATLFIRKSSAASPAQLAGKKIGAPPFDGGRKLWPIFVESTVVGAPQWQNVDAAQREVQFANGQLDAITGFFFTSMLNIEAAGMSGYDYNVYPFYEAGVRVYGNVILVNPKFLRDNPKTVTRFVRAFHTSFKRALRDTAEAVKYVKQADPKINEPLELRRARLAFDRFVRTAAVLEEGLGTINMARVAEGITTVVRAQKLAVTPNPASIASIEYLPPGADRQAQ